MSGPCSPIKNRINRSLLARAAVVVDDLSVGDGAGVLYDGAAYGVDPLLLLLLSVRDEVHGLTRGGELEGVGPVEHVLGALDGEAGGDGDDAAGHGGARDGRVLEPEEPPLLEHEPPPPPRLDVLALLGQPTHALRNTPELHAAARRIGVRGRRAGAHHRPPQARRHGCGEFWGSDRVWRVASNFFFSFREEEAGLFWLDGWFWLDCPRYNRASRADCIIGLQQNQIIS